MGPQARRRRACQSYGWGLWGNGPPGRQRRTNAAEHAGIELPHEFADILQLTRACTVCAQALRRHHGFVQGLRQIEPGHLDGGQGNELGPERL